MPRPYVDTTTSCQRAFGVAIHVTGEAGRPALMRVQWAPSSRE